MLKNYNYFMFNIFLYNNFFWYKVWVNKKVYKQRNKNFQYYFTKKFSNKSKKYISPFNKKNIYSIFRCKKFPSANGFFFINSTSLCNFCTCCAFTTKIKSILMFWNVQVEDLSGRWCQLLERLSVIPKNTFFSTHLIIIINFRIKIKCNYCHDIKTFGL